MSSTNNQPYNDKYHRLIDGYSCHHCNYIFIFKSQIIKHSVLKHKPLNAKQDLNSQYTKVKVYTDNSIFEN